MEPLYLNSEDALYSYLKKFLSDKPKAVQLDGSLKPKSNSQVMVVFEYSLDGKSYKLLGDLTRKAAESFVRLVEEHGDAGAVLKENPDSKVGGLILANSNQANGWSCKPYVKKTADKLKKVS